MFIDSHLINLKTMLQDNLIKRIIKNTGIIFSGNSTASALSIISFTIMANQLGPESLAILVLAQTYALIINDIFNVQTWESMVKFGSIKSENEKIANVIKTNFVLDFISAIAAFLFAILLVRPVVHILGWDESLIYITSLYSLSILFNITTFTIGIPRLFDKFLSIAKIYVAMASIKLVSILYAMYFSKPLIFYICVYLFIDILINLLLIVFSIVLLRNTLDRNWWKTKLKIDRDQIKFIWWTNLRTIVRIPVRYFDMVVISSVISIKMVGIYKVYKEIAGLISRIGEPVNQSIYPEFTKLIGNNDIKKAVSITKTTILLLLGVGATMTLSLLLMSKFLVGTVFGVEYLTQINALYVMLILFGISFVTVPINSLFIAAGFAKFNFYIVLFTNTMYLFTAFYFGKFIGIYGVILAYALQMILNKALKIYLLNKCSNDWSNTIR